MTWSHDQGILISSGDVHTVHQAKWWEGRNQRGEASKRCCLGMLNFRMLVNGGGYMDYL